MCRVVMLHSLQQHKEREDTREELGKLSRIQCQFNNGAINTMRYSHLLRMTTRNSHHLRMTIIPDERETVKVFEKKQGGQ